MLPSDFKKAAEVIPKILVNRQRRASDKVTDGWKPISSDGASGSAHQPSDLGLTNDIIVFQPFDGGPVIVVTSDRFDMTLSRGFHIPSREQ